MMNDNTSKESKEKFGLEEYLLEDINYMKEHMEKNLAIANNTIEEQNNELEKANGKIADLEAEIQILKKKQMENRILSPIFYFKNHLKIRF